MNHCAITFRETRCGLLRLSKNYENFLLLSQRRRSRGRWSSEQPSSVILVQGKINLAGKVGEGETTSKAENKYQPKTAQQKSTSGMQKEENQETAKVFEDDLDKKMCPR